jgi:hypothetical protein
VHNGGGAVTEYERLEECFRLMFKRQHDYENQGERFGLRLVAGLSRFLGFPPEKIAPVPRDGGEPGKHYSVHTALKLSREDAWFHMDLRVYVATGWIVVPVSFKKPGPDAPHWEVRLDRGAAAMNVREQREEVDLEELLLNWSRVRQETMPTALEDFLSSSGRKGPAGFVVERDQ